MNASRDLIDHAFKLLAEPNAHQDEIQLRRIVSASYYALFHHVVGEAVALIAPNVPLKTNHRIQRWFEHTEMKNVCGRFLPAKLDKPLLDLIGTTAPPDLQNVARSFIELQQARHAADYDLSYTLDWAEARRFGLLAAGAIAAWDRIADSAAANIFILSLLLWKNWEKDRP